MPSCAGSDVRFEASRYTYSDLLPEGGASEKEVEVNPDTSSLIRAVTVTVCAEADVSTVAGLIANEASVGAAESPGAVWVNPIGKPAFVRSPGYTARELPAASPR